MNGTADISVDQRYRYLLTRDWPLIGEPRKAVFVMLNPSTADANTDDPTIRRCISFAKAWGNSGLIVANLYAYRATNPSQLWNLAADPVGPRNDDTIAMLARKHGHIVCAWGANARAERVKHVLGILKRNAAVPYHLGLTKDGQPRHPLYLPKEAALTPWTETSAGARPSANPLDR